MLKFEFYGEDCMNITRLVDLPRNARPFNLQEKRRRMKLW